ncbi:MAG: SsrA-binding protein SmpB [Chloroherpetonaceae bacterium]|nr:SsrA-binding protein SmpB [bacterium]
MGNQESQDRKIRVISSNRRAEHDYEIIQKLEAGIILQGTEVKSLREGKCSLQDSYCGFPKRDSNELLVYNMHIPEYSHGNIANHKPKRPRKLLLHEREARKLHTAINEKGLTIIPLSIYFSGPFAKLEIALVRPKRKYDKREATKEKEITRDIKRKYGKVL